MQKIPKTDIFQVHDIVKNYKHPVKDGVLRFLLMCYGSESSFVQEYENLEKRRSVLAQVCKIEDYPEIISLEDEEFSDLLNYYLCEIEHQTTFQMLISCELAFQEYQEQIRKPIKKREVHTEVDAEGKTKVKTESGLNQDEILKACETKGKLEELSEKTAKRISEYREKIWRVTGTDGPKTVMKKLRPETINV